MDSAHNKQTLKPGRAQTPAPASRSTPEPAPASAYGGVPGLLSAHTAVALQRAVGNTAVTRLLAGRASSPVTPGSAGGFVQRMTEWKKTNHPDKYLDTFAEALNAVVQKAAITALDPESLPDLDGYITLWKDTSILVRALANDQIDRDDEDAVAEAQAAKKFGPARYGHAVESLASRETGTLTGALPAGCAYQLQASRGMTRPDIVVAHNVQGEIGWFDITSEGSIGHIDLKTGSGWKARRYVAEFTYPTLDIGKVGTSQLSIGERVALKNAIKRRAKAWETLVASKTREFMNGWNDGEGDSQNKQNQQKLAREVAGQLLGLGAEASPQITKSLIRVFKLSVKDFGFDAGGTKAEGEELLRNAFGA